MLESKHVGVDYDFIGEKVLNKDFVPKYLLVDQIANVFTKSLSTIRFSQLCSKHISTSAIE